MEFNKSSKILKGMIYVYLALPIMLFVYGWVRWYYALPILILILYCLYRCLKNDTFTGRLPEKINWEKLAAALLLIFIWVYLSGIGGLGYQNSDFQARNAIFRVLVEYEWPVLSFEKDSALVYYIGYWLPAALVGKVFGYTIGSGFLYLWSVLGVCLFYYLVCLWRKKFELWPLFVIIFFSGMDAIGAVLSGEAPLSVWTKEHLEIWAVTAQFTSMTSQLYYVFNQSLPAWIATVLIMVQENNKNIWFILSCIIITSTFPFVGLIFVSLYYALYRMKRSRHNILETIKGFFTLQNLTGVFVIGILSVMYLMNSQQSGSSSVKQIPVSHLPYIIVHYGTFLFLEAGVFFIFIWKYYKKTVLTYILFVWLCMCPFITVGGYIDFCMRASIPELLVLMLFCIEALNRYMKERKMLWYIPLILVLCIGAITPFHEIHRAISKGISANLDGARYYAGEYNIEDQLLTKKNFSGKVKDNIFFKNLSRVKYDGYIEKWYPEESDVGEKNELD